MINTRKYKYYIGIDCGVSTGICVWSRWDKKIRHLATVKIHKAMEAVKFWHESNPNDVFVRVEDARKATFGRKDDMHKAKGAGSVMRDAKVWEDYLRDLQADFEMVRPNNKTTKLDADLFKKITGYTSLTSNHARDAAMLVFGL